MASHDIEAYHRALIDDLLCKAGIECTEPPPEYTESIEECEELSDYEGLECLEEMMKFEHIELEIEETHEELEVTEEFGALFPSPSLRNVFAMKILPDNIRQFEQINRIHVLPEQFNSSIDPDLIPKIAKTAPQPYIDVLAELVGCKEYSSSMAEFWFLDTLANLLRKGQADGFDRASQAVLILWFCEFIKEIQHFDAADRARMMKRFESNMLGAAMFIADNDRMPAPADIGVDYKPPVDDDAEQIPSPPIPSLESSQHGGKSKVTFDNSSYQCNLKNLTRIIQYIFELFSTDYQYDLVRSIFTATPEYVRIFAPHELHKPKSLYTIVAKPKSGKKAKPKEAKDKKSKKDKIPDTAEYLELMNLKKKEEEELQQLEQKEAEEWEMKTHILPLSLAVDEEFFKRYWPVGSTIQEEKSAKGKGKKK